MLLYEQKAIAEILIEINRQRWVKGNDRKRQKPHETWRDGSLS